MVQMVDTWPLFFPNTTIPNIVPKYVLVLYYTCYFTKIGASKTKDTEHENFNKYKKKETHPNDILSKLLYGFFTVELILFVIAGSL